MISRIVTLALFSYSGAKRFRLDAERSAQKVTSRTSGTKFGMVSELYTYGAPGTSDSQPLTNGRREDGCFLGLRSYTDTERKADGGANFGREQHYHPKVPVVSLRKDNVSLSEYFPCPEAKTLDNAKHRSTWKLPMRGMTDWGLHHLPNYWHLLGNVTTLGTIKGISRRDKGTIKKARDFGYLARATYLELGECKSMMKKGLPYWRLVAKEGTKDSVLIAQHRRTKGCALAFTGTNEGGEFARSITSHPSSFCGLDHKVHSGYKDELRDIANHVWPLIRPKLERCSTVTCVGHSLGGSLCDLFTACANSWNVEDPDFQKFTWAKRRATTMAEVTSCVDMMDSAGRQRKHCI